MDFTLGSHNVVILGALNGIRYQYISFTEIMFILEEELRDPTINTHRSVPAVLCLLSMLWAWEWMLKLSLLFSLN